MTTEVRKIINIVVELVLLGGLVLVAVLAVNIGKDSVNAFSEQQAMRPKLIAGTELTRGTVGYYELTDIIDFYAPTIDVYITYQRDGINYILTFTSKVDSGRAGDGTVRLLVSGGGYTNEYRRDAGILYRNGTPLGTEGHLVLAGDMGFSSSNPYALQALKTVPGNGMLGYEFTQALFEWALDARFVCTVTQTYDTSKIESITLNLI